MQLVPFDQIAWHAGASRWGNRTGLNYYSLGIEIDTLSTVRSNAVNLVEVAMQDLDLARIQLEHNKEFWAASHRLAIDLHKLWLKSQLIEFAYRIVVLGVGASFAFMGYRLFVVGITGDSQFEAGAKGLTLSLQHTAPGIFFALFGTALIITGIWKLLPLPSAQMPSVDLGPPPAKADGSQPPA